MGRREHSGNRPAWKRYPLLTAFGARGPFAFTGKPLSSLLIEVRGCQLFITGVTPLRDNGDRYTATGAEYGYVLGPAAAEQLLAALGRDFNGRAEEIIPREFEFFNPRWQLKQYLDDLQLSYVYYFAAGEPL